MFDLKIIIIIIILLIVLSCLIFIINRKLKLNGGKFEVYASDEVINDELNEELKCFKDNVFDNDDVYLIVFERNKYEKIMLNELKRTVYNPHNDNVNSINDEPIKFTLRKHGNTNTRIVLNYNGTYELIKNNNRLDEEEESAKIKNCYKIISRNKFNIIIIHHDKLSHDINIYLFKNLDEAKRKLEVLENKRRIEIDDVINNKRNRLNKYSMLIISKYFDTVDDYTNVEDVDENYNGITDDYHFNPISITDKEQLKTFKNVETYHRYNEKAPDEGIDDELEFIFNDKGEELKTIIWRKINVAKSNEYIDFENIENGKYIYKCLYYEDEDDINLDIIELPDYINTLIDRNFEYYKLSSINIPSNVTSIGDRCFNGCSNLLSIDIPEKVERIGNECFKDCRRLSSITIPISVTSIGDRCFEGCTNLININN